MAGVEKKHIVDGRETTVAEVARELGVSRQQIYMCMHHYRAGLQTIANMIRENLIMNGQHRSARWMVDGKWTTVSQAAGALGVNPQVIRNWMSRHRHPDGTPATLAEAVEFYRAGLNHRRGHVAVQHRVGRKTMTTFEAAERLGISINAIRLYMSKNRASLAATIRHYEQKKQRKAEKDILSILLEGKS